jgi:RNA recognition motif. (a.k.a. RRM, RBD, or RNP domain)
MISPTLYSPPHANGILGGESTASFYHFPVVWIRGLLFKCQDRDIYSFFAGLDIVDYLRVNKDGRFTGEAYVVFANHMQVKLALQRDCQNMGYCYVEVFACKKSDYYNAVAAEVSFLFFLFSCFIHIFLFIDVGLVYSTLSLQTL